VKKYTKYSVLVGILIVIGYFLYFLTQPKPISEKSSTTYKKELPAFIKKTLLKDSLQLPIDTLTPKKTINPAGTYLLFQLLKTFENTESLQAIQTTQEIPLSKALPVHKDKDSVPHLYVSIMENQYLMQEDVTFLLSFIEQGNYAFIAAQKFDEYFMTSLLGTSVPTFNGFYDTAATINFVHPHYQREKPLVISNVNLNWAGYPANCDWTVFQEFNHQNIAKITSVQQTTYSNCMLIQYGKGRLVLQCNPGCLGNYNLVRDDGRIHAEILFSHFPRCNIHWHQNFGKYSEYKRSRPKYKKSAPEKSRTSPLQFILKNSALRWAFILLVIGTLLYVLVFSKRQQRVIPPVEAKYNTSLAFVDVVSKLYFQQKQHGKLLVHIRQAFFVFIRERYFINITLQEPDLIVRLSEKSGVEDVRVKEILERLKKAGSTITEAELVETYVQLSYFYAHCN
jgi:hypothetical protein